MDEFLKENYSLLTKSVELIALLTGLACFKKYSATPAKYVIYFLCFAFLVDLLGDYPSILKRSDLFHLIEGTLLERNYWWYTIFWWIGLSFFMFYINLKNTTNIRYKKILSYAFYLYLVQILLTLIFRFEYIFRPEERIIKIASLWMVILSIIVYFFETLTSDRIILFYKSIFFYFNSIIFVWVLIMIPMDFFEAYFVQDDWSYVLFKWKVFLLLNIFLYITLSIALVICVPETNQSKE
ncbi:hypothetical protein [Winogradskyella algicola]|uniref:hypothetical protein n=1 Tax=Winogradskyella algicola TaxID=2575815 RepID=UPI001108EE9E|nr:hypothetical protein [Winogradskyella algicola]